MAWRFPLVWLVPCFALGISLAAYIPGFSAAWASIGLSLSILLAIALYSLSWKGQTYSRLYSVSVLFSFAALGAWTYDLHLPQNRPGHYTRLIKPGRQCAEIRLCERLRPSAAHEKWVAEVVALAGRRTRGKLCVYLPKTKRGRAFQAGEKLRIYARFRKPQKPLNPYAFDYARSLFNRGVARQVFLKDEAFERLCDVPGFLASIRRRVARVIAQGGLSLEAQALLKALWLGSRADLPRTSLRAFRQLGVVHVLAVSGLHIGILVLLLRLLFSFLLRWRWGRSARALLTWVVLLLFTALLHFKPSVTRAALLFSSLVLTEMRGRPTNPFNALALAAGLTLVLWPKMLFQVGFQLSYAVVVFLLWFSPAVKQLCHPRNRVLAYLWWLFALSLIAQLGALPFTLFYFHQFAVLAALGNLGVIPLVTALLSLGVLWLITAALGFPLPLLTALINRTTSAMLGFVKSLSQLPFATLTGVYFDAFMALSLLGSLFFLGLSFEYQKPRCLLVALLLIASMQLHFLGEKYRSAKRKTFVIFDAQGTNLALYRVGERAFVFCRPADAAKNRLILQPYFTHEMISKLRYLPLEADYPGTGVKKWRNYLYTGDFMLQILSGKRCYREKWRADFIWLQELPPVNYLPRGALAQPHFLILDASSRRKNAVTLKRLTAAIPGLKVYDTRVSGAFQLSVN